jgi:hypothetical protein
VKEALERYCSNVCEALRRQVTPEERKAQEEADVLQRAEAQRKRRDAKAKRSEEEARLSSWLKLKKHHTFDVSRKQIMPVRFLCPGSQASGNIALLMYDLKIVNTLDENVTIKDAKIRYTLNGEQFVEDSHVLPTGTIPDDPQPALIVRQVTHPNANVILQGWRNLRKEIGNYRLLHSGEVLTGSALFVLGFNNPNSFLLIKDLEVVITDFSGNEMP